MSIDSSADRLPPLPSEEWSAEQREQVEEIIRGPRGTLAPPASFLGLGRRASWI
jgi:hypothetical protein